MHDRPSKSDLFKGRHFGQESFMLCIRWYLRYKLSDRDLKPLQASAFTSWRVDETYVRIRSRWAYLYGLSILSARPSTFDLDLIPKNRVKEP